MTGRTKALPSQQGVMGQIKPDAVALRDGHSAAGAGASGGKQVAAHHASSNWLVRQASGGVPRMDQMLGFIQVGTSWQQALAGSVHVAHACAHALSHAYYHMHTRAACHH